MSEPDFRSERSETREGKGNARKAWDAYARTTNKYVTPVISPVVEPAAAAVARTMVADLIGFWALWHLNGGFEGMEKYGYSQATIFRKVKRFRRVFKQHPDDFVFPGITIDAQAYWDDAERRRAEREGVDNDSEA